MQESMELLIEANKLLNNWTHERRNTVKQFRDLADEIQLIQARAEESRDVTIAGAGRAAVSVSAGISFSRDAGISVLFTAGVALPIAAASTFSAIVAASTSAIVGNKLVNLKASLLDEAIVKGKKVSGEFWEKLQIIEAKINGVKVPTVKFVITLGTFRYNCYNLGGKIPESGDEVAVAINAFQALDDFVKFSYVASIGLSSISLLFND
jgi:hypothetical protein